MNRFNMPVICSEFFLYKFKLEITYLKRHLEFDNSILYLILMGLHIGLLIEGMICTETGYTYTMSSNKNKVVSGLVLFLHRLIPNIAHQWKKQVGITSRTENL